MRRPAPPVLLALALASCTVTTTGAPCGSDLECPTGQGCGSGGTCSAAALSCPGHGPAGECIPGTSCDGSQLLTCTAGTGVCATGPVATDCPAHQACAGAAGSAACACAPTTCSASVTSYCSGGEVVTCAQDGSNAKACWYPASSSACSDPAQACVQAGGSAACTCPAANACSQAGAVQCGGAAGQQVLRCQPATAGSACLTWQPVLDCAASSLVCSGGACACPPNAGPTFVADAASGSAAGASPSPTGVASPAPCRFRTITDALAAAARAGPGATVLARGWTPAIAGGTMVFDEPGPLAVGAGIAVATDDAPPAATHYALTTSASLAGPFVTMGPGASLTGVEIRNATSSGDGVRTACPTATDVAPVSLSTLLVTAAASGPPAVRFVTGVHASGSCPVHLDAVTVTGAATGLLVAAGGPSVESTATGSTFTGSTSAGVAIAEGRLTLSGGAVTANATGATVGASGTGAPSLSATGTAFTGNLGDAIFVGRGTLVADACPFSSNGTHVHVQPVAGSTVNVTVQNSAGAARMTGATNSALRLLAMGSGSSLTLMGNEIVGNGATQDYNVASGLRRGGGVVFTSPFPATVAFRGNIVAGNQWDQVLVAASAPDALDLSAGSSCDANTNVFACYDTARSGVGLYSNGALVNASWSSWTRQPAVMSIDVAGTGIIGYDTRACSPASLACP